ncbi:midasin isoform X2 [Tribolium castaneum]|uniref:midasin isoform X2 n=1 Tax=Tribolium castaneum TaxID=7070 RepID=UPI0030FEEAEE
MEVTSEDELLFHKLKSFCEINEQFCIAFKLTEKRTGLNRHQKNDQHLHYIAQHVITIAVYFQSVVTHFSEFLPKIVSIATVELGQHRANCVLLGRIIRIRNDLHCYATKYFESNPSPFEDESYPVSKKRKMSQITISELDLVESCYALLKSDPQFYGKKWNWSEFITKYLNHESPEIQWIACHCISVLTHMSENQLRDLILSKLPQETHEKFSCIYNNSLTLGKTGSEIVALDQHPVIGISKETQDVVDISGVYIPKLKSSVTPHHNLIMVNSTRDNLRKVAFGLSSKKAICLQGPVGSGKTSLVEHIANKTGRKLGENFVKVQLGDQTDSKMLLGTYRCTDIPGEFVWQPGVVTQAVIEGNWVLLEDIDSASMDIASVLSSLLENGSLTVPGYRDSLPITPGFQLFFTQRLVSTITGHHKKHSNAMTLLEKHLLQINIDPLTSAELEEILITQHPQFATIADRMIKVFHLFTTNTDLPKSSRLISTRDFFKWLSRAAIDFDIKSQSSALKVLQDAIDVFCCSYAKPDEALGLAKQISTHLGIINQKAEFFFKSYKPVIKLSASHLEVGRAVMARNNDVLSLRQSYYFTRPSTVLLERVMCCVKLQEPVLLVGETGTGKTSTVQYLANAIGQKLVVINMNQQSDSADLLGGYKPVDLKFVITPIRKEFEALFCEFFQVEPNRTFLGHIARCYNEQRWSDLVKLMTKSYDAAISRLKQPSPKKHLLARWQSLGEKLHKLTLQLKQKSALAFAFIEGSLVRAVEEGHWVLLDEINLANAETLECLSGLLEGAEGSLCLLERGDKAPVERHPNFTLFACMNPSTDVGKKDLPAGLRNRFTEFYVDELVERNDLVLLVGSYLEALSLKEGELERIVEFYLRVRKETEVSLVDGLGHKPHFSLRSLCRALMITGRNPCGMVKKSLYEAFCLSFLTQLDEQSYGIVEKLIAKYLVGDDKALKAVLKQPIPTPKSNSDDYVQFEGYWVRKGDLECLVPDDYVLTESVRKNLKDLVRIVSIGGLPVLLQTRRRGSAAFAGKQGFITLRDLFRWGERYRLAQNTQKLYDWDQHLADEGYLVLAGRVRKSDEKKEIITVLQKHLKREVNPHNLFTLSEKTSVVTRDILTKIYQNRDKYKNIVWTYNMRQLAVLVAKAFHFKEPVLLVGETGGGKTTVCKLIAELNQQELISVNCHMHTESSDFIGGLRPVRDHVDDDVNKLFEWVDGPLIKAMLKGNVFLADEISLADDSVLERLNSLLEPERTLLLAEKGADINNPNNSELIVADPNFYFIGTMNPGGDFGKKELSPALRNRFTEIWCESCTDRDDLIAIIEQNVKEGISFGNQQDGSSGIGKNIMDFVEWFRGTEIGKRCTVSIRDILTWVNFINNCAEKIGVYESYLHGLHLTFLDALGTGITGTENLNNLKKFKHCCELFIKKQLNSSTLPHVFSPNLLIEESDNSFGIKPFYIETGNEPPTPNSFTFSAPTTTYNTLRLLRGMQLNKAILLEGSPGVGKTSLVTALAKLTRHKIFRVNLSDQTDISDLFGADLPVEGGSGGQFSWRDGPLLQALKQGHWILLDELNLASQSVLEGLNACLDHRGEIFIPELGKTFHVRPGTRFFACQNPLKQGGSRRGLPQSFLNRFIQVYVNSLTSKDLELILTNQFRAIPREIIDKMLKFNSRVCDELDGHSFGNKGAPWELNLRDLSRWCEAMIYHFEANPSVDKKYQPESLVHLIYGDRMRTLRDKRKVSEMFEEVFGRGISGDAPVLYTNSEQVWIGDVGLWRNRDGVDVNVISDEKSCLVLRTQLPVLRSLAYCVNLNWMSLLVGSSAAGKSTVVRALAHIVGKTLRTLPVTSAMDTTDILGGFEQTDYSRHLEEIVRETEQLLLKIVRTMLVKGRPCVELLRLWEGYSNVDSDVKTKRTMEEELSLFLRKLDELEKIWAVLPGTDKLRRKARKMRMSVKNEGSLNAGGKFEWVDSVLIKCLQEGSWLLVDNVNLCSAAVLDRLNALLEPNGVLTVGERGVDEKGQMVEIVPHPDFRLFLTMDPKNGEISRAMRNRGVEIYMLNEKENEHRNTLDIKSLISREGLKNINHIESLLHLHDFTSELILGEKPNVNELLRASALISQQIQHGSNQLDAFHNTIMEIYYKTRSNMEFTCNDFDTVIKTEIGKVLHQATAQQFYDAVTLKTDKLHVGTDLEKIKQQATALQNNPVDKYFLIHFYSVTSKQDLELRSRYVNCLIGDNHSVAISQTMHNFIESFPVEFKDFPIDGRWIPETNYRGKCCFASNRLILSLHFIANRTMEQLCGKKPGQVTLHDYMTQRQENTISDQFDDVLVDEFLHLIESFDSSLLKVLTDKIELSDLDVIKLLELLTWRFIFNRCTRIDVRKITPNQLTSLKVHYRWFLKYSVNSVELLLNKQSRELEDVLAKINKSLEKQFSPLHKFSQTFQKRSKPPPRVASLEIDLATCYQQVLRQFDALKHANLRNKIISLMLDRGTSLDVKISELKMLDFGENAANLSESEVKLLPVVEFLVKLQLRNHFEGQDFRSCLSVPIDLVTALCLYRESKDGRLCHSLLRSFFAYLASSDCGFQPVLSHCLLDETAKFGNFRDLMKQHRQLGLILWRNLQQLHENAYDYRANECEFVCQSFEGFIAMISESLGLKTGDFHQLVAICLRELETVCTDELSESFLGHLRNCAKTYRSLNECEDFHLSLLYVHDMHVELSYAKAILNSRLPLIDPSVKKALKKKYSVETIRSFEDLRDSFVQMNEVYSGNVKTLHSHYKPVVDMIQTLNIRNEQLGSYVAVRPREVLYEDVVKVVNHAFSTILSCRYVDGIIQNVDSVVRDLIRGEWTPDSERILKQYESSLSSYSNLINEWSKYAPSYPDVIEPLLSNLSEFLYGLKSNLALVRKLVLRHECAKFGFDMQDELGALVAIPSLDRQHIRYESLIESYSKPQVHKFIDYALGSEENANVKKERLRLLKCGIQETFNNCILDVNSTGILNFSHFENFLKAFVSAWNEQEKNRELAEAEASALYKTRTKCDDKPEAEQIEDELKELFPNYHDQDFADIMRKVDEIESVEKKSQPDVISHEDVKFVVDLHVSLVQNFTKTEWLNPEKDKTVVVDFLNPLIEKHKLFKQICGKVLPALDYRLDKDLVESMSVLLCFVQNYGDTNYLVEPPSPVKISQSKRFDFYKDSNIEEVKSSFHILEELRIRTRSLLSEWPDHPTLKSIMTIIERVYSFDLASPLLRFLTAFEILLSKCNEWEEVAHSGVSLSENAQTITHQVIAWRKMELNVWKDLLNSTFTRMNGPTYKWWLYLYNIMEQFEEKYTEIELIEALQNYVTKSNLAEFQTRLNLLHAFHCHAVHRKRTDKSDRFVSILWNVYNYFLQFAQIVNNKIKDLRAPIEKKLKDYVKIVRWKDVNYWAIKETVDKSHKTLHKYVREFQDVLNQPVSPHLVNTSNSNKIENVGIWDRPQRNAVKTYHYTLDPATYVAKESFRKKLSPKSSKSHQKLSNKIDSYFSEARKLCKDSISAMKYPKMIQTLDDLVTQIIETSSHLQNLEVDTSLDKDKQKSAAKNILNQKHRALADLFKVLSQMGLSFRTGLVEAKLKMAAEDFLLKPIDLSANFSHINYKRQDEKILTMWDNCEMYYLKSLMRADVLDTALKTPAQDLGQQNIARCRGFTSNLLSLAQKHKSQLTQSSNLFYYLRHYTNQMTKICDSREFLPLETIANIQLTMKNVQIVLNQTKIVLNSCPGDDFTGSETPVLVLKPEPEFIQYKNDQLWNKCNNLVSETLIIANKICLDLEKSKGEVPHFDLEPFKLNFVPISDPNSIQIKLDNIETNLSEVAKVFGKTKLGQSLSWILGEVKRLKLSENELNCNFDIGKSLKQLEKLTDSLGEKISQVVNTLHKKYSDLGQDNDQEVIQDDHLKVQIIENLENDFKDLCIGEIFDLCHEIARLFFTIPPNFLNEARNLISCVLPLLEQISLYHQYFLTQQVSAYRVINKMNSVLLNIFIDLASRGFCVPPELTDDSEEGVSKPSDGLGLGEGQGEKDVSDKIESEDQLDDAQPAGQEKDKEEDADCKEEDKGIEMSEDFDSKLQDVEPKDDDEDEEDNDSDADEQMGETEKDANRQDKETYGSDNEDENVESEEKEERGEGGEKDGEKELGAKENDKKSEDKPDKDSTNEKEENKKEINEMEEPEFDDEQTDPYHGNQPELPEPEPMDLPDDLQLDEGQEPDNNQDEENPFDIDAMKEDNPFEGKEKEEQEQENEDKPENEYSSDDEEITKNEENLEEQTKKEQDGMKEKLEEPEDEAETEENTQVEESGFDLTQTNEDNVEAMDVDKSDATDKVTANQAENQSNQPIDDLCQEDKPDKEGVGQSQMEESSTGHSAQTTNPQEMQSSKRQRDEDLKKQQKPGDSDAQRSLGDVNEPVKKKLKTIDSKNDNESEGEEAGDKDEEAEMYKHIKEAKESAAQVLDVATKEQAEDQKYEVQHTEEEKGEEVEESSETLPPEEEEKVENVDTSVQKPEKTEGKKNKADKKQHPEGDILDEVQDIEIEGETVETMSVPRGTDTTYHTLYDELANRTFSRLTHEEMNSLRHEVEKQLAAWTEVPSDMEADRAWQKISSVMSSLAQDLSEQLRLVLEPTQASRLRGDFRTGRRINMRKVIPYIASQFRKDKIWLRRTKPSKREYQIVLAIDDSSSMADNHSKELAFESVALISKALTLLESGQLSVVSFGENTEILHKLTDQFTDKSGVKLLQKFQFDQNKTCVGKLVDFVSEMFAQSQMQSAALNAKLLVIVSDGRGVFSEGESVVRQAVRRAKLANIFMVFVIIDNPENKNSILDIRMPSFKDGKLLGIQNYMDVFPFSFYIILRDINSLPNVLSDALRQWFEVVSNLDKQ